MNFWEIIEFKKKLSSHDVAQRYEDHMPLRCKSMSSTQRKVNILWGEVIEETKEQIDPDSQGFSYNYVLIIDAENACPRQFGEIICNGFPNSNPLWRDYVLSWSHLSYMSLDYF